MKTAPRQLYFGWTTTSLKPESYQYALKSDVIDIVRKNEECALYPTAEAVEDLANKLNRSAVEKGEDKTKNAGFIQILGLKSIIIEKLKINPSDSEAIEKAYLNFQKNLKLSLLDFLNKKASLESKILQSFKLPVNAHLTRDGEFVGNEHSQTHGSKWTFKAPHFDPNALIYSHTYFPTKNVSGGKFFIIDLKQYAKDTNKPVEQLLDWERDRWVLSPSVLKDPALNEKYTKQFNTDGLIEPLLIMSTNLMQDGLPHGATPPRIEDTNLPFQRHFTRANISRVVNNG